MCQRVQGADVGRLLTGLDGQDRASAHLRLLCKSVYGPAQRLARLLHRPPKCTQVGTRHPRGEVRVESGHLSNAGGRCTKVQCPKVHYCGFLVKQLWT